MKKHYLVFSTIIIIALQGRTVFASDSSGSGRDSISKVSFSINADLVSRFIWRGQAINLNPNIQPYASVTYKNLSLGAWGSYAFSQPYAEVDLCLSYSAGPVTLSVVDYFNEDETNMSSSDYFKFSDSDTTNTSHAVEGQFIFTGPESFPFSLSLATFFYGNDKNADNNNCFSTYLELGYSHNLGDISLSYFMGGTVAEGFYAEKAAIVNVGFKASRELEFSEKVSVPVAASLILNPEAQDIFFVFSLTF